MLYRWAQPDRRLGMARPIDLLRAGYRVVAAHPRYPDSWLMMRWSG